MKNKFYLEATAFSARLTIIFHTDYPYSGRCSRMIYSYFALKLFVSKLSISNTSQHLEIHRQVEPTHTLIQWPQHIIWLTEIFPSKINWLGSFQGEAANLWSLTWPHKCLFLFSSASVLLQFLWELHSSQPHPLSSKCNPFLIWYLVEIFFFLLYQNIWKMNLKQKARCTHEFLNQICWEKTHAKQNSSVTLGIKHPSTFTQSHLCYMSTLT